MLILALLYHTASANRSPSHTAKVVVLHNSLCACGNITIITIDYDRLDVHHGVMALDPFGLFFIIDLTIITGFN